MIHLEPCPFCGTAPIFEICDIEPCNCGTGFIMCNSDDCLIEPEIYFGTGTSVTADEAIAMWNHRA